MAKFYALATRMLSIVVLIVFGTSCVKTDDDTYVASYVSVDTISMQTNAEQGSANSYFTDVWLTLDGLDRGGYELPAKVPLLATGKHTVVFRPGIKLNGIAATRVRYFMVKPIEMTLDLVKDSVVSFSNLQTSYYDDVHFALLEDFEDLNIALDTTSNNTALWDKSSVSDGKGYVFEGFHSGMATLDTAHRYMQIVTKENFEDIPQQGHPVFVELNFKTDVMVVFSVNAYTNGIAKTTDLLYLNPTTTWKKIYINLTPTLGYATDAESFKFILSAKYSGPHNGSAHVWIDNYKILYRDN